MPPAEALLDRLRPLGPNFTAGDAQRAGVVWRDLYALRDAELIVQLSRGLYQLAETAADTENLDFVVVCARAPHGMISLNSALVHWDLTDDLPRAVHLAVPQGTARPIIDYPPTTVHVFSTSTFALGRTTVGQEDGTQFRITDRERTVVDAFRLRHRVGEELAHSALRRYLSARPRPARLAEVARILRVGRPLTDAVRLLSA